MKFAKLHGAGNDFLLFDGRAEPGLERTLPALVPRLCHRRFGVGADGVLLLVSRGERAAAVVYWNSDGSEAAFCANGTRCAARFAAERWGWHEMTLHTGFASIVAHVHESLVTLHLPAPAKVEPWRNLAVGNEHVRGRFMIIGVPQLVVPVEWPDFWERALTPLAPALRAHAGLPVGGANVNFVRRDASGELHVRSWERGVEGETLSCGTGDTAAALIALAEAPHRGPIGVRTASGRVLTIESDGAPPACPCRLSGPAEWVADGELRPELLRG